MGIRLANLEIEKYLNYVPCIRGMSRLRSAQGYSDAIGAANGDGSNRRRLLEQGRWREKMLPTVI